MRDRGPTFYRGAQYTRPKETAGCHVLRLAGTARQWLSCSTTQPSKLPLDSTTECCLLMHLKQQSSLTHNAARVHSGLTHVFFGLMGSVGICVERHKLQPPGEYAAFRAHSPMKCEYLHLPSSSLLPSAGGTQARRGKYEPAPYRPAGGRSVALQAGSSYSAASLSAAARLFPYSSLELLLLPAVVYFVVPCHTAVTPFEPADGFADLGGPRG